MCCLCRELSHLVLICLSVRAATFFQLRVRLEIQNQHFSPDKACSRAEIVRLFLRYMFPINKMVKARPKPPGNVSSHHYVVNLFVKNAYFMCFKSIAFLPGTNTYTWISHVLRIVFAHVKHNVQHPRSCITLKSTTIATFAST